MEDKQKVIMVVSKYCNSGFYGEACRCKKCCEIQNKPYNELDEHRDWIYSQVMRGEAFIVKDINVMKFTDEGKMFYETVNLFYSSKESIPKHRQTALEQEQRELK